MRYIFFTNNFYWASTLNKTINHKMMSNENNNKILEKSIPGSSKDTDMESNSGDEKRKSLEYLKIKEETSNIRKMEAFIYMRLPPDGGFAWIVLITSFLCIVNIDGMRLSIGRIMPAISNDMDISSEQAALIASLQIGFYYFCGPFACALIHKIGYRAVCMLGACLSIFGTIFGSFAMNSISLMIFFGIIAGIGYGMVSLATQIIIGFYFEKYRPITTGILSAGSGFGLLIFSPLYNFIAINYGWRNALRCHSLFGLAVLVLSISFQQVKPTRVGQYIEKNVIEDEIETYDSVESVEISGRFQTLSDAISDTSNTTTSSVHQKPPNILESNLQKQINQQLSTYKSQNVLSKPNKKKGYTYLRCCYKTKSKEPQVTVKKSVVKNSNELDIHINLNPMNRQDILYSGKPVYQENVDQTNYEIAIAGPINKAKSMHYAMSITKPFSKDKKPIKRKAISVCCRTVSSAISILISPILLQTKEFQYLVASSFFFTLGTHVPYLYITEHVDIPHFYANYLLSAIGFTNIIFRISGGLLAYTSTTNPVYLAGVPMVFSGIFTIISGFFWTDIIWYQFFYCVILGCGFAFSASLKSIIYVKLLGLENLTNAFGLTSLANGIASFMGTNFAGLIKSHTGKTNYAFVFSGISLLLGGMVLIMLPTIIMKTSNIRSNNV